MPLLQGASRQAADVGYASNRRRLTARLDSPLPRSGGRLVKRANCLLMAGVIKMLTESERYELETIIDAHGLSKTLNAIAEICAEKAAHVGATWTDRELESRWNRCAAKVSKSAASVLRLDPLG